MKELIQEAHSEPDQLEHLYRSNPQQFKTSFDEVYSSATDNLLYKAWHARLYYQQPISAEKQEKGHGHLKTVIILSLIAFFIAKIPKVYNLTEDSFYQRHIGFIVFPFLASWFVIKHKLKGMRLYVIGAITLVSLVYVNLLPNGETNGTIVLAFIHMPLLLWSLTGLAYTGHDYGLMHKRIGYLRYNGELAIMTGLILVAGGLLTALTMGLFSIIGMHIEDFYFNVVVVWGLCASPLFATYLIEQNPTLVSKVSPILAKIFTPLVLITLCFFLPSSILLGRNPFNDREYLLVFNALLVAVMALVLFSVIETPRNQGALLNIRLLFALSVLTVVVNTIALSAITFRINEWGFTPNRLAVMGGNLLILINLFMVSRQLYKAATNPAQLTEVENTIARFLPVYSLWTLIVIFIFPLIFGYR